MKVFITGASGFLGSYLVELLLQRGESVRCLMRPSSNFHFIDQYRSVELVPGDLCDPAELRSALKGVNLVIHAAALTCAASIRHYYDVNVQGTFALLTAVRRYAPCVQRVVLISSLAAGAGIQDQTAEQIRCPFYPVSHYGRSKLMADHKAQDFADQLPITIIRPPVIYGPRDTKMLVFFKMLQKGIFLLPKGEHTISKIYAPDVALCVWRAMLAPVPSGSIYFIDDGDPQPWPDLLRQLAEVINSKIRLEATVPDWMMKFMAAMADAYRFLSGKPTFFSSDKLQEIRQPFWVCDHAKAKHELNWAPTTDWSRGVQLTYDWYKQVGWC